MQRIAKFEKVSYQEYKKANKNFSEEKWKEICNKEVSERRIETIRNNENYRNT